jgi:hypothetical protein
MGFDGSGNYTRTNGTLSGSTLWTQRAAQANPIISATEHDAEMNDVATALTDCVKANGSKAVTGNQPMAGFKHTGVGDATANDQYVALGQANTLYVAPASLTNSTVQFDSVAGTAASPGFVSGDDTDTGVFSPGANAWAVSTGGTERIRVDSSGARIFDNAITTSALLVGYHRSAAGTSNVSFYSDATVGHEAAIERASGLNGALIISNVGTGDVNLTLDGNLKFTLGGNEFSFNAVNGLKIVDENNNVGGFITTSKEAGTANRLRIFGSRGSGGIVLRTDNSGTVADRVDITNAGHLQPVTDNANTCGASGKRWSAVWAANGTIQTSDERTKKDIADSSLGLDFVKALRPVSYKWVEGSKEVTGQVDGQAPTTVSVPGQRTHFGLIAQEVKAALPEGVDFGGWVLTDKNDANSQQALRYDQFIAPLIQAVKELSTKVEVLEAELAILKGA